MLQIRWMSAAIVVCALVGTAPAQDGRVELDKVPAAVTATVKKRFPTAELIGASRETENGKTSYEVTIKDKGHHIDVTVTAEGAMTLFERRIEEKEAPQNVVAVAKEKYPGSRFEKIEEIVQIKDGKETLEYYEFRLTAADSKQWEVCITPAGKLAKDPEKIGK
jgi:hypothetical protein